MSTKVVLTSVLPAQTLSLQAKGLFEHARSHIHELSDDDHKIVATVLKAKRFIDLYLQPNDSFHFTLFRPPLKNNDTDKYMLALQDTCSLIALALSVNRFKRAE